MNAIQPLFQADWLRASFIHFRIAARRLRPLIPFELDAREGDAFVSLVAFTQSRLRPPCLGKLGQWLSQPLASHEFLNLRTYVRVGGESGIYFLSEWIPNRLAILIGPRSYGLPYRLGRLDYRCNAAQGRVRGVVQAGSKRIAYRGEFDAEQPFAVASPDSTDEFLVERYSAFTMHAGRARCFRVMHEPWLLAPLELDLLDRTLLDSFAPQLREVEPFAAHYSPGVVDVGISWPTTCSGQLGHVGTAL